MAVDTGWDAFCDLLGRDEPVRLLEIGGRAVSSHQWLAPPAWRRTGLDILPGTGVDLEGDAHELADLVERDAFDAIVSTAVFEHLLQPWRVAIAMNHALRCGGLARIASHESFPLHEQPWDFWRFGDGCWSVLFGPATGFEVLATAKGSPATIVGVADGSRSRGHQHTVALVRKVRDVGGHAAWSRGARIADLLPPGHGYAGTAEVSLAQRLWIVATGRPFAMGEVRRARQFHAALAACQGGWTAIVAAAGIDRSRLAAPAADCHVVAAGGLSDALLGHLDRLPAGSVANLALLDVVHAVASPWRLAGAVRRILRPGGTVHVETAQTLPGEVPGWRLSSEALFGLFPRDAGFELVHRGMSEPCRMEPDEPAEANPRGAFGRLRTFGLARLLRA